MSIEKVSSAVEIVLPPGVFMTTIPRWVALSTSTLSTPTPARPTIRSRSAASMTLRVTFVSERTTIATVSRTSGNNSASAGRLSRTVTLNSDRCCNRAIPFGEMGSQISTFISRGRTLGQGRRRVKSSKRGERRQSKIRKEPGLNLRVVRTAQRYADEPSPQRGTRAQIRPGYGVRLVRCRGALLTAEASSSALIGVLFVVQTASDGLGQFRRGIGLL